MSARRRSILISTLALACLAATAVAVIALDGSSRGRRHGHAHAAAAALFSPALSEHARGGARRHSGRLAEAFSATATAGRCVGVHVKGHCLLRVRPAVSLRRADLRALLAHSAVLDGHRVPVHLALRHVMDALRRTEPALKRASSQTPAPISRVTARMAKAFPVLAQRKRQSHEEARQLHLLSGPSGSLLRSGLSAAGANLVLARRTYSYPNGDAGYLIPGRNGQLCTIHLYHGQLLGGGCSRLDSRLEHKGTVGTMVTEDGYDIYGLLPHGTHVLRILDSRHHAHYLAVNRWGGFDFVGEGIMERAEAKMSDGRWQTIEEGPFPPPPPALEELQPHPGRHMHRAGGH